MNCHQFPTPKLSVLLPTYNCAHLIEVAIQSVLTQSFENFELLILDDGSKDGTDKIIIQFLTDKRVSYFYKANSGLGDTLNFGINLAKSEYIIRMDADDISVPSRFEKLYCFMEQHPKVVACGSAISYFLNSPTNEKLYPCTLPSDNEPILAGLLKLSHVLCHSSLIVRTQIARKVGGYAIPGIGEDWDFFLQLSKEGELHNLSEQLYWVRLNPKSVTNNRYVECILNYKFSIYRYQYNIAISELENFKNKQKKSFVSTSFLQLDNLSLIFYRKGLKSYILHEKIGYYFYLLIAGILSPIRVRNRMSRILRYGF